MESPGTRQERQMIFDFAREHGKDVHEIDFEWISVYGEPYRMHYDNGVRNIEDMKLALYGTKEVQSNYSEMVAKLIVL